jgi:hypothetical protein
MDNEMVPIDLVPLPGHKVETADAVRARLANQVKWLDGSWFSVDGKLVTRDERDGVDYPVLRKVKYCGGFERELARLLGFEYGDKRLRKSLERLSQKGCIIRRTHAWHFTGVWAELPEPTIILTAKGEFLAGEGLPRD